MNLAYYLTSHGLGHAVRACAVCEHLPQQANVIFRTSVAESFLREALQRPFRWQEGRFDCGCLQSDSVTVDIAGTAAVYGRIAQDNRRQLDREVAWCRSQGIDVVVSDITPFAFEVAAAAGLPSIAVANFTWHDVYAEYVADCPALQPLLDQMARQYAAADLLLEVAPALPMACFSRRKAVGIVGRPGRNVRELLCRSLGVRPGRRLALLYTGTFGMPLDWKRLERFGDWVFLTVEPLPGAPANCRVFSRSELRFGDVAASVDLMVSKLGYGIMSGCMLDAVPLLYLPRERFAEYPALAAEVERWGHGMRLSQEQFRQLDWGDALAWAASAPRPAPLPDTGAAACASAMVEVGARPTPPMRP